LSQDNEARTRKNQIDPQLTNAHWDVSNPNQVGIEIPVDGISAAAWTQLKEKLHSLSDGKVEYLTLPSGISDYALYRTNGEIIAVVEAKRASVDVRLAQAQAEFYVSEIEKRQSFRPFAFLANGSNTYFFDSGFAARREVADFFSRDDLENLLYLRQHRLPLGSIPINMAITDRPYQHEAIRRVSEAFESGKRRALLVMATGTGKTRTTMSLIDVFMRANQARRVLFVADRDALVQQALDDGFHNEVAVGQLPEVGAEAQLAADALHGLRAELATLAAPLQGPLNPPATGGQGIVAHLGDPSSDAIAGTDLRDA